MCKQLSSFQLGLLTLPKYGISDDSRRRAMILRMAFFHVTARTGNGIRFSVSAAPDCAMFLTRRLTHGYPLVYYCLRAMRCLTKACFFRTELVV